MAAAAIFKITKRDVFATVWQIFTKFGMVMQYGFLNRQDR